ncbi:MAG: DUF3558 domain-containing protein [Pseudonocardiaceae bacterium]|nr:DUF3558 domain-containing protein [Pseudonocardiaceae bacterium]
MRIWNGYGSTRRACRTSRTSFGTARSSTGSTRRRSRRALGIGVPDGRRITVLLAVLATAALTACTNSDAGTATPQSQSRSAPNKSTGALPPRPEEVKLDGVKPCDLLTRQQQDKLQIDRANWYPEVDKEFNTRPCFFSKNRSQPYFSYGVMAVTNHGADYWLRQNSDTQLTDVAGFPTVASRPAGTTKAKCEMAVDVAEGQMLYVDMEPITTNAFDQNQMCDMAKQAATAAVETLKTVK